MCAVETTSGEKALSGQFGEFCFEAEHVSVSMSSADGEGFERSLYIGLSQTGKLYAATRSQTRLLASNVNSFNVASGFLIFTTTAHLAQFAPVDVLVSLLQNADDSSPLPEWETRRVERGSRIVATVPSTMSLVLQMPRGNLEIINPRPLVMKIVKQDIDRFVLLWNHLGDC